MQDLKSNIRILVYGSKEFGRVIRYLVNDCGRVFGGFVDDWYVGDDILGPFEAVVSLFSPQQCEFVIAVGYKNLAARWTVYQKVIDAGYRVTTLVHPLAYVAPSAKVENGSIVMAGASVDSAATVKALAVLWPGSVVSHDSEVGENCFLSPNATLCGYSRVGRDSFVGAGAVVVDHATVPRGCFLKAGSVFSGTKRSRVGEP